MIRKYTELFVIKDNGSREKFLIGYKCIYVFLLLANILLFLFNKTERPGELVPIASNYFLYFFSFYFFYTILNIFSLIQIIRKKNKYSIVSIEKLISVSRILAIFCVGLGVGWLVVYFSPVFYSFWSPFIWFKFPELSSDPILKYILAVSIWCLVFLGLFLFELLYFRNIGRSSKDFLGQ